MPGQVPELWEKQDLDLLWACIGAEATVCSTAIDASEVFSGVRRPVVANKG